eukprot:jgi/Botrbrau1/20737/Bobra.0058s0065.1
MKLDSVTGTLHNAPGVVGCSVPTPYGMHKCGTLIIVAGPPGWYPHMLVTTYCHMLVTKFCNMLVTTYCHMLVIISEVRKCEWLGSSTPRGAC